jgi:hypothetical protein
MTRAPDVPVTASAWRSPTDYDAEHLAPINAYTRVILADHEIALGQQPLDARRRGSL